MMFPAGRRVTLTTTEQLIGGYVGAVRQVSSNVRGEEHRSRKGSGGEYWCHFEAAAAELAFAKWLGLYWTGLGQKTATDVGPFGVRWTRYQTGDLRLEKDDPDDQVYWLVIGERGRYLVRGCIRAGDGKLRHYWGQKTDRPPAYWVPQAALRDRPD